MAIPQRPFGPTGAQVPSLGQGTWNMEFDASANHLRALMCGIDAGLTHIDTAEMYGSGRAERMVGEAIAGRRDEVFLVSKVLPENASRRGTIAACERSLKRLGTDRLDCYLLHWPGGHPIEETIAAFEELVQAGKIRSWGVSNLDEEELAEAIAVAGPDRLACNQVYYALRQRGAEHAVIPFCEKQGIAVVAYSPFGSGRFPRPRTRAGRVLAEIAETYGATPHQVALAFLTRLPSVFAIPKAAHVAHVADNAAAGKLSLRDADLRRIEQAFPRGPRYLGVPSL